MSLTPEPNAGAPAPIALVIPETRRRPWRTWLFSGLAVAAVGAFLAWKAGVDPRRMLTRPVIELTTLPVDEGSLAAVITETGSLESSDNATVRCQVEALMGLTGGTPGAPGTPGARPGGAGGQQPGANGQQPGANGQPGQNLQPTPTAAKMKTAAKSKAGAATATGATAKAAAGTAAAGAAGGAAAGGAAGGAAAGGNAAGGAGAAGGNAAGGTATAGAAGTTTPKKPVIRSFTYMVAPYVPQPKPMGTVQAQPKQQIDPAMMGGRGGRGGGGMMGMQEKPGATRIISILPEGTKVTKGQLVCELDSSAFRDELQAQEIRWAKAKAAVEQVQAILEVNEITLKEYRDGIFPQDVELIRQYLVTCKTERDRANKNLKWSQETAAKGFRSPAQVQADALNLQQAEIALTEAEGMAYRLQKFTSPKLIKNLLAKLEAIKSDKLAQESAFQLESDRRKKLKAMIANCTLRAPRAGIVVYANQSNPWGQISNQIQEGVTVREGQTIINLPNPQNMRVRAKVNESKIAHIHSGQRAEVVVDAFPDRPLRGRVAEVTPIPAPANGPISDVRVYFATVNIDSEGFDELRPGLSAEVSFLVGVPRKVTRVPLQAVRWVRSTPYAAVATRAGSESKSAWEWRPLTLGQTDPSYAEVVSGLKPGDRVIAQPEALPAPKAAPFTPGRPAVASADGGPRG